MEAYPLSLGEAKSIQLGIEKTALPPATREEARSGQNCIVESQWMRGGAKSGVLTMSKKREKLEMPICARVSASKFRTLEMWCDNSFRKRSEVVGLVLERVLDIVEQQARLEQPVEEFIRHLHADRPQ